MKKVKSVFKNFMTKVGNADPMIWGYVMLGGKMNNNLQPKTQMKTDED